MTVQLVGAGALRRLEQLPSAIANANPDAMARAALAVKRSIERQPGFHHRLRNVGRRGSRLLVRFDVKGRANAVALVRAVGPMQLIERDTRAHTILPRGLGRSGGRRGMARHNARQQLFDALFAGRVGSGVKPMRTPYGPRFIVQHPGTRGRHPFERGAEAALPEVRRIVNNRVEAALGQVLR